MRLIESRPRRLYCPWCDDSFPLPTHGEIKRLSSATCPYDGFEVLMYSSGR